MMRIVIDLQGAQTHGSRNRGIGRYSTSLAKSVIRNKGEHEILLALNGAFPESVQAIREEFADCLEQSAIHVWHPLVGVDQLNMANKDRRRASEYLREAFLAKLRPDIVHVSSLFEGLGDTAICSIGRLGKPFLTSVTLFDLIPLLNRDVYLGNETTARWYEGRLDELRRADLLLAISKSSAQEAVNYLPWREDALAVAGTAADPVFVKRKVGIGREQEIRRRYGLQRPFVMYTGGIDIRKNIEGLIQAYARLAVDIREAHQLAIVCSIQPQDRDRLTMLAAKSGLGEGEVVFTDFVSEEDLIDLYNLCSLFVFPSWHEGFGLPALEAMQCGAAVVAADRSSLPEVIGLKEAMFDPFSDEAMSVIMTKGLMDTAFRKRLLDNGVKQADAFSWDNVGKAFISAVEDRVARETSLPTKIAVAKRKTLAFVSPIPPSRSGIAVYGAELLPELARHYDITCVVQDDCKGVPSTPFVQANLQVIGVSDFEACAHSFDRIVYQLGNSDHHKHMFALIDEFPGVIVLHDFFLSGVSAYIECHCREKDWWSRALYRSHGYEGVFQRFALNNEDLARWTYPCSGHIAASALGAIYHSASTLGLYEKWFGSEGKDSWYKVPQLYHVRDQQNRTSIRADLDIDEQCYLVTSFGFMGETKLNHLLLEAWIKSGLAKERNCRLVFVGELPGDAYGDAIKAQIKQIPNGSVQITGWVDENQYNRYLGASDCAVQLRTRSRGETSRAVLDTMAGGIPTIVNANGSMADIPDDCVVKLEDEFDVGELADALSSLYSNKKLGQKLGEAARAMVLTQHHPARCAALYHEAIEASYDRASLDVRLIADSLKNLDLSGNERMDISVGLASLTAEPCEMIVDVTYLVSNPDSLEAAAWQRAFSSFLEAATGYRVETVYWSELHNSFLYARAYTLQAMGLPSIDIADEPVVFRPGAVVAIIGRAEACRWEALRSLFGLNLYRAILDEAFACINKEEAKVERCGALSDFLDRNGLYLSSVFS